MTFYQSHFPYKRVQEVEEIAMMDRGRKFIRSLRWTLLDNFVGTCLNGIGRYHGRREWVCMLVLCVWVLKYVKREFSVYFYIYASLYTPRNVWYTDCRHGFIYTYMLAYKYTHEHIHIPPITHTWGHTHLSIVYITSHFLASMHANELFYSTQSTNLIFQTFRTKHNSKPQLSFQTLLEQAKKAVYICPSNQCLSTSNYVTGSTYSRYPYPPSPHTHEYYGLATPSIVSFT